MAKPPRPRPEPDREAFTGRYLIPDPETREQRAWTRATTFADTVSDTFGLTRWQMRMVALGLAQRRDLLTGVAAVLDPDSRDGKKRLDSLIEDAKEHAGSTTRATLGTALHSFCEAVDTGRPLPEIPAPYDADIAAYRTELARAGVQVSKNYVERVAIVPSLGVAGTLDRLVMVPGFSLPLVGDVKTGAELDYSATKIAVQLALYSRAEWIWDLEERVHRPMHEVDQEQALVIHLPAGEARCTLLLADIRAGWEMTRIITAVRDWRGRKDLLTPLVKVAVG
jgi:hypothetical protein